MENNDHIKIIGHRGYPHVAPENTLSSFNMAVKAGAHAIEFDLHQTLDNQLVIHHDYKLGKPDNEKGEIYLTSYKEIKQLDAGNWFSSNFKGEKIPILSKVFEVYGKTIEYEIELKGATKSFVDKVVNIADQYRLLSLIEFTSPHIPILSYLKKKNAFIRTGIFFSQYPTWMSILQRENIIVGSLELLPADVAHIPLNIATETLVKAIHKKHKLVHIADCNTEEELLIAKQRGCDQLSTNMVELAVKLLCG